MMSPFIKNLSNVDSWLKACQQDYMTPYELSQLRNFIMEVLPHVDGCMINDSYFKGLKNRFPKDYWQTLTKTKRAPIIKAIFAASVIREFILREVRANPNTEANNHTGYMQFFPELAAGDSAESVYLPRYFWAIRTTMAFVPGYYNKYMFLKIGSLIEGSGAVYSTGGAPSLATRRRISIYEKICSVNPIPRAAKSKRSRKEMEDNEDDEQDMIVEEQPKSKICAIKVEECNFEDALEFEDFELGDLSNFNDLLFNSDLLLSGEELQYVFQG